jgi:NADPH:quinone reductase-like Zn-dependent oxidoreductase
MRVFAQAISLVRQPGPPAAVLASTTSPGRSGRRCSAGGKARLGIVLYAEEDVLTLERLLAAGEYRPVIDRTYRLEDVVEAHRYVETRQKTGNVVLSLNGGPL